MGTVITEKGKTMSEYISEYIVRETGYPGTLKQEIVGELVRCKDCKYHAIYHRFEGTIINVCARALIRNIIWEIDSEKDLCSKAEITNP